MANAKLVTADTLLKAGPGKLKGIFCSIASATPTLKIWDSLSASGTVLIDTFTPVTGVYYGPFDMFFSNGLYVDPGNTVSVTIEFE